MAYIPRCEIIHDDAHFHVTWQCHNNKPLLRWDWAKQAYYNLLLKYKTKYGIDIYSYNFMDTHPHLTGHLSDTGRFSAFFKVVNSQFARIVNKRLKRRGQVVMDRFKSPLIESDKHMLNAMAYIDLNPHRAKKVSHPSENTWSSYFYYADGKDDPLITPSPSYLALGRNPIERRREYMAIVEGLMQNRKEMNITRTHFIGNPDWVVKKYRELCGKLGRKVTEAMVTRMTGPP